jgi:glucokinase
LENIIGIDLGATQMRAARIEDNEIVFLSTEKTPTNDSYDQVLNKLIELITSVFSIKTVAIGIGVPSVVDVEHGIIYDVINIPSWKEVPLKSILEAIFLSLFL